MTDPTHDQPIYVTYPSRGEWLNAALVIGWFVSGVVTVIHELTS